MPIGPVERSPLFLESRFPLESQFRQFYEHVVLLKQGATDSSIRSGDSSATATKGDGKLTPEEMREQLLSLLKEQSKRARLTPGIRSEDLDEAQYIAVATADEVFVNFNWPGCQYWTNHLLESRMFSTHIAGERFFSSLTKLLHGLNRAQRDLAAVYLLALGVGFRGKYREEDPEGKIADYQKNLLWFIRQDEPDHPSQQKDILFPQVEEHVYERGTGKRLRSLRYWAIAVACSAAVWLFVSYFVWDWLASPIEEIASQVEAAVKSIR